MSTAGSGDFFAAEPSSREESSCRSAGFRPDCGEVELGMDEEMVAVISEFPRNIEYGCRER